MKASDKNFLVLLPHEKEDINYERFREMVGTAIHRSCYALPSEEMETFFQNFYKLGYEQYKSVRFGLTISYAHLRKLSKILNSIMVAESEDPLHDLKLVVEMHKAKSSFISRNVNNVLKVDRNSNEYEKYLGDLYNGDFDDDAFAKIINAVAGARRSFMEKYSYLSKNNLLKDFYEEELESIISESLAEIESRIARIKQEKDRATLNMLTCHKADKFLINERKSRWGWKMTN